MKANYPFFIAMGGEFIALIFGFIWGANRHARKATQVAGPAQVSRPHMEPAPAMLTGGRIHGDGLIHAHAGEAVLNPQAVTMLETVFPGAVDKLNAGEALPHAMRDNTHNVNNTQCVDHAIRDNTQPKSHAKRETRNVGEVYNCKGCGVEYKARTTWHVWCDDCREKRSTAAKRSKARKAK